MDKEIEQSSREFEETKKSEGFEETKESGEIKKGEFKEFEETKKNKEPEGKQTTEDQLKEPKESEEKSEIKKEIEKSKTKKSEIEGISQRLTRSASFKPAVVQKMAQQTAQSSFDYLNEEVLNLIQNNQINESNFILFRLQKLLEKLRLRFGEDPQNAIFRKLLRRALQSMNFFLANYILDNFIRSSLKPLQVEKTPDLLFLTMYYVRDQAKEFYENLQNNTNNLNNLLRNQRTAFNYLNRSSSLDQFNPFSRTNAAVIHNLEGNYSHATGHTAKFCDFASFDRLIDKLIPHSNVNQYYVTYGTSLLALVIENISSSELNPACKLTLKERLFQICYDKLMALDYLDVNVGYEQYVENLAKNHREDLEENDANNRTGQLNNSANNLVGNSINNPAGNPTNNQANNPQSNPPNNRPTNPINQSGGRQQTAKQRPVNLPRIKRVSILQQAVNDLKYDVAERLVLKGARIDDLNVDDVVFVKSTERLFKALYFCGYRFLPANIFRLKYDQCIKDDDCFDRFCEFLKKHQTKQLPLSCLGESNFQLEGLFERFSIKEVFN